ncbi:MAG: hypothetical protein P1P69_02750 [Methanosarcinaceae archaeon]|nr:hypothetical protein [Methanosarcinaceae archaeon]
MNKLTKKLLITLLLTISLILISGCLGNENTQIPVPQSTTTLSQASSIAYNAGDMNANPQGYERAEISGKVVDTMNSGGYTYIQLDDGTGKVWAAVPQTIVEIGTQGTLTGSIMKDFTSTTLGKTFAAIIFSDGMQTAAIENPTNADVLENPASYSNVVISGTVNQTMNISTYTYIEIDDGTGLVWASVPQTNLAVSDNVTVAGGINLGFNSPTLNKTFDVLIMGTLVTDDDTTTSAESISSMPPGHGSFI